jgi:hypothetical protein
MNSTVFSSRWPPAKIQNPSGAGPPMSVEQDVIRPSADTIPTSASVGTRVTTAMTTSDHQNPAIAHALTVPTLSRSTSATRAKIAPDTPIRSSITSMPPAGAMARGY